MSDPDEPSDTGAPKPPPSTATEAPAAVPAASESREEPPLVRDETASAREDAPAPHADAPAPAPAAAPSPGPARRGRILAIANQKGGVGKTTTTINLGATLAEDGRRVLAVDFDPQGALSAGLGVQTHDVPTIYDLLLSRGIAPADAIQPTGVENLDVIPANIDLSAAEVQLVGEVAREQTLARVLTPAMSDYDVIIIDCQPSLGLLTINALTAAHGVIVPLACEYFALRGVALLKDTIDKVSTRLNPRLRIVGVLGTMYDGRTLHGREVLQTLVDGWTDTVFHTVIRRTVKFSDSTVAGEPILSYASSSAGAMAYRQLAREVWARCHAE